jgi:hypothetical protein
MNSTNKVPAPLAVARRIADVRPSALKELRMRAADARLN